MFGKNLREMLSAQLISMSIALVAGVALASATHQIELIPGLFVLLPGFLEMRGGISGSLSARLGSALHLGTLEKPYRESALLRDNILATAFLAVAVSTLLGLVAFVASHVLFQITNINLLLVSFIAGILSTVILTPLTLFVTFHSYENGVDPDNVVGPYITSGGDVISILSILFAIWVVA